MDWFRMYGEMMDDPKIGTLDDAAFRTWVELLCTACKAEDGGNTRLTKDDIDWAFRRNASETLQKLLQRELVTVTETGEIVITSWEKRQKKSDSSTGRVREHRAKAKLDKGSQEDTKDETLQKRKGNGLEKSREEKNKHTSLDAMFEEFWSAYPKKVSKAAALKAYRKIKPSESLQAEILAAVSRAKTSVDWLKDDGQFIPYPASWLNAKRWEDESSASASAPNRFVGLK